METKISAFIAVEPMLNEERVRVKVDEGKIVLKGKVERKEQKEKATEIAIRAGGDLPIKMKLSFRGKKKATFWTLLFLGVLTIILFVPPQLLVNQWLIPSMKEQFQQATGRTLSVDNVRFSFLHGPTLHLQGIAIGGEGGDHPLAKVKRIRIGFQLLPLFQKQIDLDEIRLIEPTVSLRRTLRGEWNIEISSGGRRKEGDGRYRSDRG